MYLCLVYIWNMLQYLCLYLAAAKGCVTIFLCLVFYPIHNTFNLSQYVATAYISKRSSLYVCVLVNIRTKRCVLWIYVLIYIRTGPLNCICVCIHETCNMLKEL